MSTQVVSVFFYCLLVNRMSVIWWGGLKFNDFVLVTHWEPQWAYYLWTAADCGRGTQRAACCWRSPRGIEVRLDSTLMFQVVDLKCVFCWNHPVCVEIHTQGMFCVTSVAPAAGYMVCFHFDAWKPCRAVGLRAWNKCFVMVKFLKIFSSLILNGCWKCGQEDAALNQSHFTGLLASRLEKTFVIW